MYIHMTTRIKKWGNSLAVRLPKEIAEKYQLKEGSMIDFLEDQGNIMIKPIESKKKTLKELLKLVTPENRHELIDWGDPVGNEIW